MLGKIGVTASGAKAGRVWAIVEAEDGAVFRSDDYGETWQRGSEDRNLRQRAWYYHHIYADPQDADTVWVLNVEFWKSIDGGKTFGKVPVPHGDNHDLWIDPNNANRMILGNDGGGCVSYNGGLAWSSDLQPADRRVLSRHHRHPDAVPRLRRAAGQHHDERHQPLELRCDHDDGVVPDRRRRERLHRGAAGQSGRHLRRQLRRKPRPATTTAPAAPRASTSGRR